jgi:hypothetical protein
MNPKLLLAYLTGFANSALRPFQTPVTFHSSKHQKSKKGANHKVLKIEKKTRAGSWVTTLTNHERVMVGRASRMGITLTEYKTMFVKG